METLWRASMSDNVRRLFRFVQQELLMAFRNYYKNAIYRTSEESAASQRMRVFHTSEQMFTSNNLYFTSIKFSGKLFNQRY